MKILPLVLCISACTGDAPVGRPTGSVQIVIGATRPSIEAIEVQTLDVSLGRAVVEGRGPDEADSISVLIDYTFHPLDATDAFGFDLLQGQHKDMHIGLSFGWRDEPALLFSGTLAEDDDDGDDDDDDDDDDAIPFQIEVDTLDLDFALGAIHVDETPLVARIQLDPGAWLAAIDVDDDEPLVVDSSSGEAYQQVLDAIEASTTFVSEQTP